jgi:hypothetical protein
MLPAALPAQLKAALGDGDGLGALADGCAAGWSVPAACDEAPGSAAEPPAGWLDPLVLLAPADPIAEPPAAAGVGWPDVRSALITAGSELAVVTSGPSACAEAPRADAESNGVNCHAAMAPTATTAGSASPSRLVDFCAVHGAQ